MRDRENCGTTGERKRHEMCRGMQCDSRGGDGAECREYFGSIGINRIIGINESKW